MILNPSIAFDCDLEAVKLIDDVGQQLAAVAEVYGVCGLLDIECNDAQGFGGDGGGGSLQRVGLGVNARRVGPLDPFV